MNTTRRSTILAALLTSAATLVPSVGFAYSTYESVDDIPNLLTLFQGDSAEDSDSATNDDEDSTSREDDSKERADAKKSPNGRDDASR